MILRGLAIVLVSMHRPLNTSYIIFKFHNFTCHNPDYFYHHAQLRLPFNTLIYLKIV